MQDRSYEVRVWKKIEVYKGKRKTTHTVRWRVGKEPFRQPHASAAAADSFRSDLLSATNRGEAFSLTTGRPVSWQQQSREPETTWYAFICDYTDKHWAGTSASHRRDRAQYLAKATMAMLIDGDHPDEAVLRVALRNWTLNKTHRHSVRPDDVSHALKWLADHSQPVSALNDPITARAMLTRVTSMTPENGGCQLGPKSALKAKRVLSHVLDFAVECKLLTVNPISMRRNPGAIKWQTPKVSNMVDRRSVPSPTLARTLLDAVNSLERSGPLLMPFFAVMYFAALRPEEAVNLRWSDITLPEPVWDTEGREWGDTDDAWGELTIREVAPDIGGRWTNSGKQRDTRPPKGRAVGEDRVIPCGPRLVRILRAHRARDDKGPDGLAFFGENGRQLATSTYSKMWKRARVKALTEVQHATPLARRVYDLRHACVSTWLNQGVNPAQIAEWAGHSLEVLLRIYAKCIDGGEDEARRRAERGFDGF